MKKPSRGNHREKVRLVGNQDVFILIEHLLNIRNDPFIFQFAVIINAGAGSIRSLRIYASSGFIHHLTLGHSGSPRLERNPRVLFFEEVQDSLPGTCRKPLTAGTNSGNGGKRWLHSFLSDVNNSL